MDAIALSNPGQFSRRAATAQFIVQLEHYFSAQMTTATRKLFAELPVPPDHLDCAAVDDCRAIAAMLALARRTIYQVSWDAEEYANDVPKSALPNPDAEARLMAKYGPLIMREELLHRYDDNLPIVVGPAIVADSTGRVLLWSLPDILPEGRQLKILTHTRLLEAQLTVDKAEPGAKATTRWRTADTFYSKGSAWTSGSTLLYPAGFQRGHTGLNFSPAPSADVRSARALEWMTAFEETGGMLDGILAVTHPELYESSQQLMETIWREHGESRSIMATWPSCFTSLQVIVNRSSLGHQDTGGMPGWFDLLVTLGTYEKKAVLELRSLGISLPYNAGSIVPISSKLLLHGAPRVRGDRICYAFYMTRDLYTRFHIPQVGMSSVEVSTEDQRQSRGPGERPLAALVHGTSNDFANAAIAMVRTGGSSEKHAAPHLPSAGAAADDDGESEVSERMEDGQDVAMADARAPE